MKYVIDIPDDIYQIVLMDGIGQTCSFHRKFDLTPYTNIDIKEKAEEFSKGYDAGWDAGSKFHEAEKESIEDEVWEFYQTISNMKIYEQESAFGTSSWWSVINKHSYQELKAKYEEWLKQKDDIHKDEIHVGDEVIAKANMKDALGNFYEPFVITGMLSCMVVGFGKKYKYHSIGINDVVKTGRHFTKKEIDSIKEYLEVE